MRMQPRHLLVDTRSGNLKLSDFGQAGLWDTEAGDSTDLTYVSSAALSAHAAPEVRSVIGTMPPLAQSMVISVQVAVLGLRSGVCYALDATFF